jgi:hypothetical protein
MLPARNTLADGSADSHLHFSEIGLSLTEWHGVLELHPDIWLRWSDTENRLIATGLEQAQAESHRADTQTQRADAEARRAEKLANSCES